MYELQVLDDPDGRTPNFRRHLGSPVLVAGESLAVARQVKRRSVLPVAAEDRANSTAEAPRPQIERERRAPLDVPWARSGRRHRISRDVESEYEVTTILRRHSDEGNWPSDSGQSPTSFDLAKAEDRFRDVRAERTFIRAHDSMVSAPAAPLMRSSGRRSKCTRHAGHAVSVPMCAPGAGRSCEPEIWSTCSPASSSVMPNS